VAHATDEIDRLPRTMHVLRLVTASGGEIGGLV
jgi:hypothetical protein